MRRNLPEPIVKGFARKDPGFDSPIIYSSFSKAKFMVGLLKKFFFVEKEIIFSFFVSDF